MLHNYMYVVILACYTGEICLFIMTVPFLPVFYCQKICLRTQQNCIPDHGTLVLRHIALIHDARLPLLIHDMSHLIGKTSIDLYALITEGELAVTLHVPCCDHLERFH